MSATNDLGLTTRGSSTACDCTTHRKPQPPTATSTQSFGVIGMTCEHCVRSVTAELTAYPEVKKIDISLVPDGVSTVTVESSRPLSREQIASAIADAGYQLAPLD
ncbi:heavy-metal-associated domain-containing protein [Rathayibacter toxicus]|uniref:Copper chaperone n=1 Tax=Rathayibacter toxicus TaxID=145458 RepID=A0A2S5Y5K6_9MICO|nr:heavy-metal-associated domain-containing protein [Rathayibacter toxicus]PPH21846.1 copper chaperone [Rathayibacter toxicus]PPH56277.1 copper chaperone [Rathayibacter toxicus]PPH58373.1 copper chaperone [Rathayibacter toxicus]PPH86119.1 copper chaperone [Rathayibacter toxicus]PPI14005.1 copper chaperone [Rathayibacter toxicus]